MLLAAVVAIVAFQSAPVGEDGGIAVSIRLRSAPESFNPPPSVRTGELTASGVYVERSFVSIRPRR